MLQDPSPGFRLQLIGPEDEKDLSIPTALGCWEKVLWWPTFTKHQVSPSAVWQSKDGRLCSFYLLKVSSQRVFLSAMWVQMRNRGQQISVSSLSQLLPQWSRFFWLLLISEKVVQLQSLSCSPLRRLS